MKTNNFLNCIADDNRRKILLSLGEKQKCVCEVTQELQLEQSLVSYHLQLLKNCGLVTARKEGKKHYYKIIDTEIYHILQQITKTSEKLNISGDCLSYD
jgi:ArsR family transcriptional regulator